MTRKKILIASGCAALAVAGICAAVFLLQPRGGLEMEANATIGSMPGIDEATRRRQLQEMLDESKIAFSINTNPLYDVKTGQMNLLLENPSNNAKLLTVEIRLAGEEEPIYQSKAILPGSYLENVKLEKPLAPGTYDATVFLRGYHQETQALIGQTGAEITITAVS